MSTTATPDHPLARRTRQHFVAELSRRLGEVGAAVKERLTQALEQVSSVREMQERRDAWTLFQSQGRAWEEAVAAAWQRAARADPAAVPSKPVPPVLELTLVGDDVVENKILASRLALALQERIGGPLAELCVRVQQLEKSDELGPDDVLRPETLMRLLIEQWLATRLPRASLLLVVETLQRELAAHVLDACKSCEALLVSSGVQTDGETKYRVRLTQMSSASPGQHAAQARREAPTGQDALDSVLPDPARRGPDTAQPLARDDGQRNRHLADGQMVAAMSPLARARRRAQGVLGQLRRVLSEQTAGIFEATAKQEITPTLAHALQRSQSMVDPDMLIGDTESADGVAYTQASVVRVAGVLRERSNELKKKASTDGEKATIEIVALMFQSILAEERIPAAVRVWFARLQLPVLRVALAEPEFFGTLNHPARQLIDRMGSCALGFDAHAIGGSALEAEIRRVVQVIEQYPETGRRVFQLVYDEFQKFLSKYLTEKGAASKVVSVAQQVEQKETLAIQYTIELRNMLKDMPVRDEVREFLFKVWADVLAQSAVLSGPASEDTRMLKRLAGDLIWSASAKTTREERTEVLQRLPPLLKLLREGMAKAGVTTERQDEHVRDLNAALAAAFAAKSAAISSERLGEITEKLEALDEILPELGDVDLDADTLRDLSGYESADLEVVAEGGTMPTPAMMSWAFELKLGAWFQLDYRGRQEPVQLAWRGLQKQLALFVTPQGRGVLFQLHRLGAFLQAGLLVPMEDESLTVRATRDALAKLDADPQRLLS